MKKEISLALIVSFVSLGLPLYAQDNDWQSVDSTHKSVQNTLQETANRMDNWFGEPKADNPAKATLRVIMDNRWDKHDGYSIKPRLRGSLKLPTLQERLNIVFGDETLDNELSAAADISTQSPSNPQDKNFDTRQARQDNSTIGLQWLVPNKSDDISTKVSIGLRSGGDVYGKAKVAKNWYHQDNIKSRAEFIYRYGTQSEHFARTNFELSHATANRLISKAQLRLEYTNKDNADQWSWGNTFSRRHLTGDDVWFDYGFYTGGYIEDDEFTLNTYGPFAGFRTHAYRDWLFVQPEITYYNDKKADQDHHIGVMVRLEAQF